MHPGRRVTYQPYVGKATVGGVLRLVSEAVRRLALRARDQRT
jgi:hypothetical protein